MTAASIRRTTLALVLAGTPAVAAEHVVGMASMTYSPSSLVAKVGDVIRFKNDDPGESHAVFIPTKGFGIDLGAQKPNEVRELMLFKAGTFDVECVVHDHMHLRVTVVP